MQAVLQGQRFVLATLVLLVAQPAFAQTYAEQSTAFLFDDPSTSGAPALSLSDESEVSLNLPWPVPFYGAPYESVSISDNGALRFNQGLLSQSSDTCFPSALAGGNPDVAVFWDALQPGLLGSAHAELHTSPPRFVISWIDYEHSLHPSLGSASFQVVLYPSGTIDVRYSSTALGDVSVDFGASATVGVQNAVGGTNHAGDSLASSCNVPTALGNSARRFVTPTTSMQTGSACATETVTTATLRSCPGRRRSATRSTKTATETSLRTS